LGLTKDFAIKKAKEVFKNTGNKQYVLSSPENYNDIFNNTMYKIVSEINENEIISVIYETK
jgi:hypothetical protein